MYNLTEFTEKFNKIKGKTIAIVYIFEGDTDAGFEHFYIWKSHIITKWMNAVEDLSCLPLILDVRTFLDKAINKTLPHLDYVINLNSGTYNLSTMALVPAMCSAINVPCIPCDAVTIGTGENKLLSNHIARSIGINVPPALPKEDASGIFRPISLGNSLGVHRGYASQDKHGIYQSFIPGYEITTPLVYNVLEGKLELLPTVVFAPQNNDPNWYYGEKDKSQQSGYYFEIISLDEDLKKRYLELASTLSIQTYCRIDARVMCNSIADMKKTLMSGATITNTYFIEINVMPTIRDNNSFSYSFEHIDQTSSLYNYIKFMNMFVNKVNITNFLLASAMLSFV